MAVDPNKLIDDIYEASFVAELWPDVLSRLANIADCVGGTIFVQSQDDVRWVASKEAYPIMSDFVSEGWIPRNTRANRCINRRYSGFLNDFDLFTEEELDIEPAYTEFLRPRGLGWWCGTAVPSSCMDMIVLDLEKQYDKGPVSRDVLSILDAFRPHLAQAALTSARLAAERARGVVGAFEMMGLPGAVLSQTGRLVAANSAFEAMNERVRLQAFDKMSFRAPAADALLVDAIRKCKQNRKSARSFVLPGNEEAAPAIVHLLPLHGQARDIFTHGELVLVITPLTQAELPQAHIIASLFNLTPGEARVARLLCSGQTAKMIARQLSLTPQTICSYAKAVRTKTGVSRGSELAWLLSAVTLPGQH